MKPWLQLTLIVMTVGGGFAGFAATLESLFNSSDASKLSLLLRVMVLGLYAFVIASGLSLVRDPTRTGPLIAALALQIPSLSSPVIVYEFATGLGAFIDVGSLGKGNTVGFHFSWLLGADLSFAVLQDHPLRVGVNVVALTIFLLVWWTVHPTSRLEQPNRPTDPMYRGQ